MRISNQNPPCILHTCLLRVKFWRSHGSAWSAMHSQSMRKCWLWLHLHFYYYLFLFLHTNATTNLSNWVFLHHILRRTLTRKMKKLFIIIYQKSILFKTPNPNYFQIFSKIHLKYWLFIQQSRTYTICWHFEDMFMTIAAAS